MTPWVKFILTSCLGLALAATCSAVGAPPLTTGDTGGVPGGASAPISFSGSTTAGSLWVLSIFIQDTTSTVTTINGYTGCSGPALGSWTVVTNKGSTTQAILLYTPNQIASCSGVNITLSASTTWAAKFVEYGGMATATPLDCNNTTGGTGTGTTAASGSCTSTCTNETVVIAGGMKTGGNTFTPQVGNGYTIAIQRAGGSQSEVVEDKNTLVAGAQSDSPTVGSSGEYALNTAVFKQSTSVCGGTVAPTQIGVFSIGP